MTGVLSIAHGYPNPHVVGKRQSATLISGSPSGSDNVDVTAKIARAHLNEFPDYYSRLAVMEAEAEAYWESQGK